MMSVPVFVGLDVAKATLDVAVRPSGDHWRVSNDEPGIASLVARLQPLAPSLLVAEATGGFERAAIAALAAAGLPVVVANPRQIRDFARATGQLAKSKAPMGACIRIVAGIGDWCPLLQLPIGKVVGKACPIVVAALEHVGWPNPLGLFPLASMS
jgi:transposase